MIQFLKKNIVLAIACSAALVTTFFVPPDKAYLSYFDARTLTCLFCTLAVICALKNIHFFQIVARKIILFFKNLRATILALIYVTFIGSMLIANDMALLTFLPLGYLVLNSTGRTDKLAFTFVMQTIAANLGGMLTPFGNPQNLYMYSYFQIPTGEFIKIMLPPFLLSIFLITMCTIVFVKKEPLSLENETIHHLHRILTAIYLALFAFSIAIVFRAVSCLTGIVVIVVALFILDRNALLKVDYPLLLTFCAFFVFAGNMARIPAVHTFLSGMMEKNALLCGVASCQVISNVPSAVLLSKFTDHYPALLVAVNIGGTGTLIASLASLITFKEYTKRMKGQAWHYIKMYSLFNFGILLLLFVFATWLDI